MRAACPFSLVFFVAANASSFLEYNGDPSPVEANGVAAARMPEQAARDDSNMKSSIDDGMDSDKDVASDQEADKVEPEDLASDENVDVAPAPAKQDKPASEKVPIDGYLVGDDALPDVTRGDTVKTEVVPHSHDQTMVDNKSSDDDEAADEDEQEKLSTKSSFEKESDNADGAGSEKMPSFAGDASVEATAISKHAGRKLSDDQGLDGEIDVDRDDAGAELSNEKKKNAIFSKSSNKEGAGATDSTDIDDGVASGAASGDRVMASAASHKEGEVQSDGKPGDHENHFGGDGAKPHLAMETGQDASSWKASVEDRVDAADSTDSDDTAAGADDLSVAAMPISKEEGGTASEDESFSDETDVDGSDASSVDVDDKGPVGFASDVERDNVATAASTKGRRVTSAVKSADDETDVADNVDTESDTMDSAENLSDHKRDSVATAASKERRERFSDDKSADAGGSFDDVGSESTMEIKQETSSSEASLEEEGEDAVDGRDSDETSSGKDDQLAGMVDSKDESDTDSGDESVGADSDADGVGMVMDETEEDGKALEKINAEETVEGRVVTSENSEVVEKASGADGEQNPMSSDEKTAVAEEPLGVNDAVSFAAGSRINEVENTVSDDSPSDSSNGNLDQDYLREFAAKENRFGAPPPLKNAAESDKKAISADEPNGDARATIQNSKDQEQDDDAATTDQESKKPKVAAEKIYVPQQQLMHRKHEQVLRNVDALDLKRKILASKAFQEKVRSMCQRYNNLPKCEQKATEVAFCQLLERAKPEAAAQLCAQVPQDPTKYGMLQEGVTVSMPPPSQLRGRLRAFVDEAVEELAREFEIDF